MTQKDFPEVVYAGRNASGELVFSTKPFEGCVTYNLQKDFLCDDTSGLYYPIFLEH